MTTEQKTATISREFMNWYKANGRKLPWRETTDPYKIWISEIILQQTRVAQGTDYYLHFLKKFPDIHSLASSSEDAVLKAWQGLGYYSRARNLHTASKQIMTHFEGKFPSNYSEILSLKGIGEYTAAAIASIAFKQPYPVIDGNVLRVISRLYGIDIPIRSSEAKKMIGMMAKSLLNRQDPGGFNQAIMDFGATICTPSQPKCASCVVRDYCVAQLENRVNDLPINNSKKRIKERYFNYFHILQGDRTYVHQRRKNDIWRNLFEFPLIESCKTMDIETLRKTKAFSELFSSLPNVPIEKVFALKHQLTHQTIHATFYRVYIPPEFEFFPPEGIVEIGSEHLNSLAVSRLSHKYIETI